MDCTKPRQSGRRQLTSMYHSISAAGGRFVTRRISFCVKSFTTSVAVSRPVTTIGLIPEGVVMKYYFLAFATVITVCVGCTSAGGNRVACRSGSAHLSDSDGVVARGKIDHGNQQNYVMPPANLVANPGPMVEGPGPGVLNAIGMASAGSFTGR